MYYSEHTHVVYDKPYITIHWDSTNKIVMMQWKEFVYGEDFREALNKGLSVITEHHAHRWLADLRKLGVLSDNDQKWSNEDWFPRALHGGINRMAIVLPERAVAKMSVNNIMRKVTDNTLITNYFATIEEAHNWLADA